MTSSGMKRGLAVSAVTALAVTGLPFLTVSANATPIADEFADNAIAFYTQQVAGVSDKNDGTNTTISLVTGGGANVTSVLYQYTLAAAPTTWVDVPGGLVGRNADGVFAFDWANAPETVTQLRAVPNTGVANADTQAALTIVDATANTVELATEGALGYFRTPYTEAPGDFVGATGTVSGPVAVTVSDVSHVTGSATATVTNDGVASTTETFDAVLDISGYPYAAGTEANQIALNAATNNTDDAEGSTLYSQSINTITATPATQEVRAGDDAKVVLKVVDQNNRPIANAQVGRFTPDGPDADTLPDSSTVLGYTDGKGELVVTETTSGTKNYYVNVNDADEYNPGVDKATSSTVNTYTPALASVDIVNERNRSNFDIDELADGDDFTIVTKDQRGNGINEDLAGDDIQYRWVIDPSGAGDTFTTDWRGGETDANGKFVVPGLTDTDYFGGPVPEGSYTLEARRPNVGGAGLMNAAPETVAASESEITYDEGASANAPVNGNFTVDGNLANDGGGLGGREIQLTYSPTGDSTFAPQSEQPSGVTVSGNSATAVTNSAGDFSVKLRDPAVPSNVTPTAETANLNAIAEESATDSTSLQGDLGPDDSIVANNPDNAEQDLTIKWQQQPTVVGLSVDMENLTFSARPGAPVDLDIQVDGSTADGMQALQDFPVSVTVNHGFLSPNAETASDLTPAAGEGDTGDLWGVWKNDGSSNTVSTGDGGTAGVVAAIGRHSGFDDDGLVTTTVTVTAGGVSETETIVWSSSNPLNGTSVSIDPMTGEPQGNVALGKTVKHNVVTLDQFGNRVGDEGVRMFDNTDDAHFSTDGFGDTAISDFVNGGASVIASADAPTSQTIEGRWWTSTTKHAVGADSAPNEGTALRTDTAPTITWVKPGGRRAINAWLKLSNNAKGNDVAFVNAPNAAHGALVRLYKVRANGTKVLLRSKRANLAGNARFVVGDRNKRTFTRYQARVLRTPRTFADWTPIRRIR